MSLLKKIFIVVILILLGVLMFDVITLNSQLDKARNECIRMNRRHNELFEIATKHFIIEGNREWGVTGNCLLEMMKVMLPVNEALGIDCTIYNDDGNPIYYENEDGTKTTSQRLPDELRLVNH